MSLSGTLKTMSLQDLLQWLATAKKTGAVSFTRGSVTKKIFLEVGTIVGSASNDPTDFLGQWLVSCGMITEGQLRIALGEQQRTSTFLGTVLVQMRALSEEEVSAVLALKVEETLYGLFHWDDASFDFHEGSFEKLPFRVALSVQDVLFKGVRRFDEIRAIREEFPDTGVVLHRTDSPLPPEVLEHPHAQRIIESIDGARSIAAIALHTHAPEFIVSKFLLELRRAGHVELAGMGRPAETRADRPPSRPEVLGPSGDGLLAAARTLMDKGDFVAALGILARAPQNDPATRSLVERAEGGLVEELYRVSLPQNRVPILARPMNELLDETLSPEEVYLLSRIEGTWDIHSIVAIAPLREIEALRVLDNLRQRGLIHVQEPSSS